VRVFSAGVAEAISYAVFLIRTWNYRAAIIKIPPTPSCSVSF